MAGNRGSPELDGRSIGFEDPDQPLPGSLIPEESCHSLSAAAPSEPADDKELVHFIGSNVAQPRGCRSDQRETRDRIANLRDIGVVSGLPYNGSIVRVASIGLGIDFKPLRHVVNVVLEQISKQRVRLGPDLRDQEIRQSLTSRWPIEGTGRSPAVPRRYTRRQRRDASRCCPASPSRRLPRTSGVPAGANLSHTLAHAFPIAPKSVPGKGASPGATTVTVRLVSTERRSAGIFFTSEATRDPRLSSS